MGHIDPSALHRPKLKGCQIDKSTQITWVSGRIAHSLAPPFAAATRRRLVENKLTKVVSPLLFFHLSYMARDMDIDDQFQVTF